MRLTAIQLEDGKKGTDDQPSVGPVYRCSLAKDGFPDSFGHPLTSWDVFRESVEKHQNNNMLGWRPMINGKAGHYVWKTFKEVYEDVLHVGSALRTSGVKPGCRIGIYGINCPQWITAMEACNGHNLICVPLYDTLGPNAVDFIIEHAEINYIFVQDKKIPALLSHSEKSMKQIKTLVCFTSLTTEQKEDAAKLGVTAYSWSDFLKMGKENPVELSPPRSLDICTIMYTSGTSGEPKGVVLTHEALAHIVLGLDLTLQHFDDKMTETDCYLSFLPLAHIFDRVIEEYFFHKGASVGYWQGDIEALKDDLMELKPTLFAGVPRVFERVHEGAVKALKELSPVRRKIFDMLYSFKLFMMNMGLSVKHAAPLADLLAFRKVKARLGGRVRLIISGGAPLGKEIEEFLRVASCSYVIQGYGLTETCAVSTICWPDDMSMFGSVGIPFVYTEVRLEEVPEMGYDPLSEVSRGEICLRGRTNFSGYYKNAELTKEAFRDGWFHTGDIGEIRPDGVIKVIDRKKNLFKLSQGEYIAVEYLEKTYGFLPIVQDIWVYGDSFKSMLVAVVVPNEQLTIEWGEWNGHRKTFAELCSLHQLKTHILSELKGAADRNKLKKFEHIKGIIIEPVPFELRPDLITPTMKKKRAPLYKYYQEDINNLYNNMK